MASTQEPTMEEILASIRKIISEDTTEPAASPSSLSGAGEPEVLDLTHEVHEESAGGATATQQLASDEKPAEQVTGTSGGEAQVSREAPLHSSEGIFSEKTRKALNEAFSDLEPPAAKVAQPGDLPGPSGLPIEAVFERAVRETFDPVLRKWLTDNADTIIERMKPVIGEWLDHHFPAMLEDAVRNEVARAVMARGRR